MTNNELKDALINRRPVCFTVPHIGEFNGKYVSAVIYRVVENRLCVSAEIADKSGRSVIIVTPEQIQYKECEK